MSDTPSPVLQLLFTTGFQPSGTTAVQESDGQGGITGGRGRFELGEWRVTVPHDENGWVCIYKLNNSKATDHRYFRTHELNGIRWFMQRKKIKRAVTNTKEGAETHG